MHINLNDELVHGLDLRVGPRRRSAFIVQALRRALEDERRWELIESAVGSIPAEGHAWEEDPAAWVRGQRTADVRRVG
jgi:hypothetical protein